MIVIFLPVTQSLRAQQYILRKTDSAGYFSFVKLREGRLSRHIGSYDVLQKSRYDYLTKWDVAENGVMYWTNGENIYRFDWNNNKSTLLFSHLYWILELCVRGDRIYIVYNPSKEIGLDDNRFAEGLRFCRFNIKTAKKEDLGLPRGYNVSNLTISNNEKWASFVNKQDDEGSKTKLNLFNLKSKRIQSIDSANLQKSEEFGDDDKFNTAYWIDSTTLLYYKHIKPDDNGRILSYNINTGEKKVWMKNFPQRDFSWFSSDGHKLYCAGRSNLYRTSDGINKEIIADDRRLDSNILQAIVQFEK